MKKLLIKTIILLVIVFSNRTNNNTNNTITTNKQTIKENEIIGYINIEKINLNMPLYKIESKHNNIEENIAILKESILPPNKNSIIFLAAHSGTSRISYFNELDKLKQNDKIIISLNKNKYTYLVKDITINKKNGYININKEKEEQLILTTCNPKNDNYQLIINCTRKES